MFKKIILISILLAAGFVYAQNSVSWKDLQNNMNEWGKGPVSLIMTNEERSTFTKLKTPEEKLQFIKLFWARRDPILRTRANEFKEEFFKRVEYANQNFAEKNVTGWQTARGKVYVIFGPPSRVDHESIADSSRPALLWVYDNLPAKRIPRNEALMFVWREFKYVLAPPNPDTGDRIAAQQASFDSSFRYQDIPTVVNAAFADVSKSNVVDEKIDYDALLFSVRSTEKFGIVEINFDPQILQTQPPQIQVNIPAASAPLYDEGTRKFAELVFVQELKKGAQVIAKNEHSESFTWSAAALDDLKEIKVKLPALEAPSGPYELHVTVQDRISGVSETRKIPVSL